MKTFLGLALATTLAFTNVPQTMARDVEHNYTLSGTSVKISADENVKAVTIILNNIQNDVVKVTLENNDGTILFDESVSKTAYYSKKLNLSQLETGSYRIIVRKKLDKTIQPFELTSEGVQLNESERKVKFLPFVSQKGYTVNVNCLTSNYTNIFVKIYDNTGKLVFEDANYMVFQLHKTFNLSQLAEGTYIMEVVAGDESEYTTVKL